MARKVVNGQTGQILFPPVARYRALGDLSWGAWIRNGPNSTFAGTIATVGAAVGETLADNSVFYIDMRGGSSMLYLHEYATGTNQSNVFSVSFTNNVWSHVMFVRDASAMTVECYQDGVLQATYNYTTQADTSATTVKYSLLSNIDGSQALDDFSIGEAVLADVAWTASERTALYHGRVPTRGLLNYAPLGLGAVEPDLSKYNARAPVTGTTIVTDHPPVGSLYERNILTRPPDFAAAAGRIMASLVRFGGLAGHGGIAGPGGGLAG